MLVTSPVVAPNIIRDVVQATPKKQIPLRLLIQSPKQCKSMQFKALFAPPNRRKAALTKTLLIMKLTVILLTVAVFSVQARGLSQTITLSVKDAPLETVFRAIERQTHYVFFTRADIFEKGKKVTLDLKNATLEEALDECFRDQPFTWSLEGRIIAVEPRTASKNPTPVLQSGDSLPPKPNKTVRIQGTVYNESGEPLSGANVVIKELSKGTTTNAKGQFVIPAVAVNSTLIISFIGYAPQLITVKDGGDLRIYLKATKNELDKVVIQAYGTTTQRLATGNIGTVTAEQIERQPVSNVLEALQGQVAGVVVTNTNGYASAPIRVEIRGRSSIGNFPSDPLYIIDGVPLTILDLRNQDSYYGGEHGDIQSGIPNPANGQSPFYSVNPGDIESLTVLKDADATAIYGSRGANGVIIITTKRGKPGKNHLDFNIYQGTTDELRPYKMLNTQQYVEMRKEALNNDGLPVNVSTAPDLVVWDTTKYTDWQKVLFGISGKMTDAQGAFSGGDERTTYRLSGGYRYQTDPLNFSGGNRRGSVSFSFTNKSLDKRFSLTFVGNYSVVSLNQIQLPGVVTAAPDAPPIFDKAGNLNYAGWAPLDGQYPFSGILQPYTSKTNLLNSNLTLAYDIYKGLNFKTSLGYNNIVATETSIQPNASEDPLQGSAAASANTSSNIGNTLVHNLIFEPQVEYNSFIKIGKLNVLAGGSFQQNITSYDNLGGEGFVDDVSITSIGSAQIHTTDNGQSEYKYSALFGRISYNLRNEFLLNFNARRDGSTKFGPGRQYGDFASVGGAWIFSEEKWIKQSLPLISFGKIRGSYGTTGSDPIGNYAYLSRYSFNPNSYNGILPVLPMGHTDSLLHWQVNKKLEAAMNIGLFSDKILLEAAWYRNRCDDQLVPFPTPQFTGFTFVTANSPANVQNSGWEFTASGNVLHTNNINWILKVNIGINRNKLLSYPNLSQSPYAGVYIVGQPLNIVRLLHNTGVDPQTGLYTFADKNKDGQITIDYTAQTVDDTYIHDLSPKFDGGFTSSFNYKRITLDLFFYFKKQIGENAISATPFPGGIANVPSAVLNRWQKPGDVAAFAKFTTTPFDISYSNFSQSDGIYTDASFVRLQNASLSYGFSDKSTRKMGVKGVKIFFRGQNLLLITKYKGSDPEIQNFGALPIPRIFTGGLTINI
jgi:TonB-linked SusC/RagA family outer membrane protein